MTAIDLTQLVNLEELDANLEEMAVLARRMALDKRRYDELKEAVRLQMAALGTEKFENHLGTFVNQHRTTVKYTNPEILPKKFQKIVGNDKLVKAHLADGGILPGVTLETTEYLVPRWKTNDEEVSEYSY